MKKIFLVVVLLSFLFNGFGHIAHGRSHEQSLYLQKEGGYSSGRGGIQSFSLDEDMVLKAGGSNINEEIKIDVYKADMAEVLNYLIYDEKGNQKNSKISFENREIILTKNIHLKDKFSIPTEKDTGVWLVRAKTSKKEIIVYAVRSKYGAVVKEGQKGLLVWVQDFKTKKNAVGIPATIYNLRDSKKTKTQVKTSQEGIVQTDNTSAEYDVMVVGEGDDAALVPINLRALNADYKNDSNEYPGQIEEKTNYIFTDRPLYKPGDKVFFKVISRIDDDFNYKIAEGDWHVEIVTGWGDTKKVIVENDYTLDSQGTISGELQLPIDVSTGKSDYRLEISNEKNKEKGDFYWWGGGSYSTPIKIEYYRKPEYTLEIKSTDKHEYISGEEISASIKGEYFSGGPLANVEVKYTVRARDAWERSYKPNSDGGDYGYSDYYGEGYGTSLKEGTVTLDSKGEGKINITAKGKKGKSQVYNITVEFVQGGKASVSSQNFIVYAGNYRIYRDSYQYGFSVGNEIKVDFALYKNRDNVEFRNTQLKVQGKRVWWEVKDKNARYRKYERREEGISLPATMDVDSEGRATLKFKPTVAGSYKIIIEGTDTLGNLIKKEFSIYVSTREYYVADGQNNLSLHIDKEQYNPGEQVTVTISGKTSDQDVLLTVERDFVHRFFIVHLDDTSKTIKLDLEDSDLPNINIMASSFSRGVLDKGFAEVKINSISKKLKVEINTDKKTYGPGEEVEVEVITKNQSGEPQQADVALWAVDKALFELAGMRQMNIHGTYWGYRYGHTRMTHSLRGIAINSAEGGGCFSAGTKVLMKNGQEKNIEEIKKGEEIMTFDTDLGKPAVGYVQGVHNLPTIGYFLLNNTLRVTGNHMIWAEGTWKRVDRLRIGDKLRDKNGKDIVVNKIEWIKNSQRVYNLTIRKYHTYIADGYFVHNGKGGEDNRYIFKDIAYWNPHVQTGTDGRAKIKFTLPDDLTTWVLTAVGATKDTVVGNGEGEILVTKPVIIRPQLPNILRRGDKAVIAAFAHNNMEEEQTFIVKLDLKNGKVENAEQSIKIPAGEFKVVRWEIPLTDNVKKIEATFSLINKENKKYRDVVVKEIPIQPFGFWETDSVVNIGDKKFDVSVGNDAYNEKTMIKLSLASTPMGSLASAMKYLIHYPYGCMEQTTSAFMPAVLAKEHPKFFAKALEGKDIDKIINKGIVRLSNKQSNDGGWSWWGGNSDIFLSTYVTEYLLRARDLGNEIDADILKRAQRYFKDRKYDVKGSKEKLILVSYGEALFGEVEEKKEIKVEESLDTDLVAMAVITNIRNGFTNKDSNGYQTLLSKIEHHGNMTYWPASSKKRFGSIDASSGIALKALLLAEGDKNIGASVLQYFLTNRKKEYWANTFATAQILESFTLYGDELQNQDKNYTTKILIDGKVFDTKTFNSEDTLAIVNIPVDKIKKGGSVISLESDGSNSSLYSTLLTKQYHTSNEASPLSKTISLERSYKKVKDDGKPISEGDEVVVDFTIKGLHREDTYLMIEDQLPAGLVPLNEHLDNATQYNNSKKKDYTTKEYTKNGVIITDRYISSDGDRHYSYRAYVVSAGEYNTPPAQAMLMYNPEIYAHSGSEIFTVVGGEYKHKNQQSESSEQSSKSTLSGLKIENYIKIISGLGILLVVVLVGGLIYKKVW